MTMRKRLMREHFSRLALEHDEALDVVRGAVLIAAEDDDSVDVESVLGDLADLGRELKDRLPEGIPADFALRALADYLHRDIGLIGDKGTYYDPKNSFIHEVLARKRGIPITLALIYMAVGRAAGLSLVGVSFPAHFLLGAYAGPVDRSRLADWFIDPFQPTELMSVDDCRDLFVKLGGTEHAFREAFLVTATHRQILARVLTNLKMVYAQTNETEKAIAAVDRLLLLNPNAATEYRDRGALHMRLDLYSLALDDFTRYLAEGPAPEERAAIEQAVEQLKSRIAMLH
jgi:regulator of sirC expression with transglutaminase-like and TPR domain